MGRTERVTRPSGWERVRHSSSAASLWSRVILSSANAEGRLRRSRLFLLVRARAARSSRIVDGRAGCRPNCRARPNANSWTRCQPARQGRHRPGERESAPGSRSILRSVRSAAGTNSKGRRETGGRDRSPGRRRVSDGDPPHRWRTRRFSRRGSKAQPALTARKGVRLVQVLEMLVTERDTDSAGPDAPTAVRQTSKRELAPPVRPPGLATRSGPHFCPHGQLCNNTQTKPLSVWSSPRGGPSKRKWAATCARPAARGLLFVHVPRSWCKG
jgi:hypothetical protein